MGDSEGTAVRHVFIVGAKSLGQYGGYETFVDKLTEQHADDPTVKYHVACKANGDGSMDETALTGVTQTVRDRRGRVREFTYHNAHVFKVPCPPIGPAVAVYYDWAALRHALRYCRRHHIEDPVFYVLTCRIGPFIRGLVRRIHAAGGTYCLNPDGHEWRRAKWNAAIRRYWKWSEGRMVGCADLVICDSLNIERYIRDEYGVDNTTYIAYGADMGKPVLADDAPRYTDWLCKAGLRAGEYYLVVGRFVPENNFETMIREFMRSRTQRSLALVTNVNDGFLAALKQRLHFGSDPRIRFVGTVYDRELLHKIREGAYGYLHGHEVGGTNPSLLESLAATKLNLLLDVGFNTEVGRDAALYWSKAEGDLASLIERADAMPPAEREAYGARARERIRSAFSWPHIAAEYKRAWAGLHGKKS